VSDNGVGFDLGTASAHSSDHYGILGMRERAEAIGAKLQLETSQGSGTTVAILMPVVR